MRTKLKSCPTKGYLVKKISELDIRKYQLLLKKCAGCSIDHKDHRWGMPHKDCKGPSFGSEKMSLVDFPASEAVGVKHVIKPDFGGDLPRNLDIPEFEFDEYGVSQTCLWMSFPTVIMMMMMMMMKRQGCVIDWSSCRLRSMHV